MGVVGEEDEERELGEFIDWAEKLVEEHKPDSYPRQINFILHVIDCEKMKDTAYQEEVSPTYFF